MKTQSEIQAVADKVDTVSPSRYPNMTYEEGVRSALDWVLGDTPDDEFIDGDNKLV